MAYSVGGLIEATDYNGFVSTSANNINAVWSTGTGDKGWGQTALGTVSASANVAATSWASLVNTLASMGNQTGTAITSRVAPVSGNTIAVLAAVSLIVNVKSAVTGVPAVPFEYGVTIAVYTYEPATREVPESTITPNFAPT